MNVVAGFTLVKVGLRRLFSANGCLPFQLAATVRASTRMMSIGCTACAANDLVQGP
jgi:hypothetical protein